MPPRLNMVAKTLTGLEGALAEELRALGAEEVKPFNRLAAFKGDKRLLYKVNLCCRTAIRVLVRLKKFNVVDEQHLYDEVKALDWSQHLGERGTLAIDPIVTNSTFTNSLFIAQKAKDAIVDQFRERTGVRPSVDLDDPDLRLNLHINQNIATLYLDSSGDSLHKRGYRGPTNIAPLNEVLAAGIIQLSEWDGKSPLVDGMCGSGTLVIEAALLAMNIAPGAFSKEFGFERWKDYDADLYREVFQEAESREARELPVRILASDKDPQAVRYAQKNVRNAGIENVVGVECKAFEDLIPPPKPGVLVMNPPYGERIALNETHRFYRMIGETLKRNWAGWRAFVLSGNPDAEDSIGLRPAKKTTLFNGPIECRLLEYRLGAKKER